MKTMTQFKSAIEAGRLKAKCDVCGIEGGPDKVYQHDSYGHVCKSCETKDDIEGIKDEIEALTRRYQKRIEELNKEKEQLLQDR